ncbi:heterokaryon incompatibility protein-domain-containing protein [Podospora didyma]|uniref:Heterokaryon incompatibility protein-domain-containing protein n=1 Tax=Podospora didyma TaxID=330526 RepID=A0AAE0NUC3_9PEZI|nr:heterokaryon incompatibility protein-domain-containing protein [Podospora didyma]
MPQIGQNYFTIDWPQNPRPCTGCCQGADPDVAHGFRRSWLRDIRETARRGCYKCLVLYSSCLEYASNASSTEINVHSSYAGALRVVRFVDNEPGETDRLYSGVQVVFPVGTMPPPPWKYISPGRKSERVEARRDEYGPLLRSWLDACDSGYRKCAMEGAKLPRRVLDVDDQLGDVVYLRRDCSGEERRYVALSHCWGKSPLPQTTTLNIDQHTQGIRFDSLPKSYQDAVTVTRTIGVRYLWIDSLCIVQDSTTDWETESSQMAQIYNHAYLIVAASQASDSTCGFIDRIEPCLELEDDDDPKGQASASIEREFSWESSSLAAKNWTPIGQIRNPDASTTSQIFRRPLKGYSYRDRHHYPLGLTPLTKRAWAFQENLLARRIVHFTPLEILWECVECGLKCECMEMDYTSTSDTDFSLVSATRKAQYTDLFCDRDADASSFWRGLLSRYSGLRLTYESDRLPALSGLAKLWHETKGAGQYLAGFWREDILESMTWKVEGLCRRSEEYRAPSWSPFSLDYADGNNGRREGVSFEYLDVHVDYTSVMKQRCATVVDARCEPVAGDLTGAVRAGFILLRGRVLRWVNQRDDTFHEGQETSDRYDRISDLDDTDKQKTTWISAGDRYRVKVEWDIWVDPNKWPILTLILIGASTRIAGASIIPRREGHLHMEPIAMVLVSTQMNGTRDGAFERVGMVYRTSLGEEDMFRLFTGEEEEIQIV